MLLSDESLQIYLSKKLGTTVMRTDHKKKLSLTDFFLTTVSHHHALLRRVPSLEREFVKVLLFSLNSKKEELKINAYCSQKSHAFVSKFVTIQK